MRVHISDLLRFGQPIQSEQIQLHVTGSRIVVALPQRAIQEQGLKATRRNLLYLCVLFV